MEAEWRDTAATHGTPGLPATTRSQDDAGKGFPTEGTWPADAFILDFEPPEQR